MIPDENYYGFPHPFAEAARFLPLELVDLELNSLINLFKVYAPGP